MKVSSKLAIIIPYFKKTYFEKVLKSLVDQTDKNFNVYIGNDTSPDSPLRIIEKYKQSLNICYHDFKTNLGARDLVAQWYRCLDLIGSEEWIWFLPDDDVPSSNCVSEFYNAIQYQEKYNIKVFRFPLSLIDKNGKVTNKLFDHNPEVESNLDFYTRLLKGKTSSSLGDNIFNKKSFLESGGFVSFPKAWGSDHATVLRVSHGGKIYCLNKTRLYFRMSGENISSDTKDGVTKLTSRIHFVNWLKSNEDLFPEKPDADFYKFFYWKGEYYVLMEWSFSFKLLFLLQRLRAKCFESNEILPIIKILLKKLGILNK